MDPDGIVVGANFGLAGVQLTGGGNFAVNVAFGLKEPTGGNGDGRSTMNEIFDGLTAISTPENMIDWDDMVTGFVWTGGGDIDFDLEIKPSYPDLVLGAGPGVDINILIDGSGVNPFSNSLHPVGILDDLRLGFEMAFL